MKRVFLFLLTNLAVMLVLGIVTSALGVNRYLTASGLNLPMLLAFSAVVGFTGAIFSLLISKPMAKWSTGARVLDNPQNETERWLVQTVRRLADKANIGMPEVAVYDGEANAFATGAFKNSSLVAVSTGLLESMTKEEVEAVLAHEIAHVVNGDMVTLTLIQGVVNTFVVFLSKVVGYFVDRVLLKNDRGGPGIGYYITDIVCQIVDYRRVVFASTRISRRCRLGVVDGVAAADGQGACAPGRSGTGRVTEEHGGIGH